MDSSAFGGWEMGRSLGCGAALIAILGAVLGGACAGCAHGWYAVPGTDRDGWWTDCKPGELGFCNTGSGPIRQTCDVDVFAGLVGHKGTCSWTRFDPKHPNYLGAAVPYVEPKQ